MARAESRLRARKPARRYNPRMGKGDKRTRKGKIYKGSYGKKRPHRQPKKSQEKVLTTPRAGRPAGRGP